MVRATRYINTLHVLWRVACYYCEATAVVCAVCCFAVKQIFVRHRRKIKLELLGTGRTFFLVVCIVWYNKWLTRIVIVALLLCGCDCDEWDRQEERQQGKAEDASRHRQTAPPPVAARPPGYSTPTSAATLYTAPFVCLFLFFIFVLPTYKLTK